MKTSVKSKKQIALLSAGALLSMAVAGTVGAMAFRTASAETITSGSSSTGTEIKLEAVQEAWSVSIPESITVGGESVPTNVIKATDVKLKEGQKLVVKVSSQNSWKLGEWDYQLDIGGSKISTNESVVLEVESSEWAGADFSAGKSSAEVKAELKEDHSKYANDELTDTLTFTVTSETEGA